MGHIFYLMGKSASGKDSLFELILSHDDINISRLVIWTTRPRRTGEQEGMEYHFTDVETMLRMEKEGRIIEHRVYPSMEGPWHYFTADDAAPDLKNQDYLGIGTLESFQKLREWYGKDVVVPLYLEVEDGLRLYRALDRERHQEHPKYEELCRRFLADQVDFSEEKLRQAGIDIRYENNEDLEAGLMKLLVTIRNIRKGKRS